MKIGFITTLQTNVGDDFVREGIRAALDRICSYQPYFIDKHHPEASCSGAEPGDSPEPIGDKILDADMVVQCGAPVYWNLGSKPGQKCANSEWTEPLWYDRIAKIYLQKPVLNIAAGACQGYFGSAAEISSDQECGAFVRDIHRFCRLTTVRDKMAYEVNASLGLPVNLHPCTSIFSWRRCLPDVANAAASKNGPIAVNFMRLAGHYDIEGRIDEGRWRIQFCEIVRLLAKASAQVLPIAHTSEERDLLKELIPGQNVFYSTNYLDYFPVYSQCRGGIFNRVHGAILLAGRGVPSVVIGNDSRSRMADEFGLPRWHVSEVEPKLVVDTLLQMIGNEATQARLLEIERRAFDQLVNQLREVVPGQADETAGRSVASATRKQSVLIAHFGGIGDLVLLSALVSSIKKAHQHWRVVVACRSNVAETIGLFPDRPDDVLAIDFNPYEWPEPSPELLDELRRVLPQFRTLAVDTYVAAALQPNWFEWILAAFLRPGRSVCCTTIPEPSGFLSLLYEDLGLKRASMHRVPLPEATQELHRYELLLEHLQIPANYSFPWVIKEKSVEKDQSEPPSDYLVCFPSGSPSTRVKRWPLDNFVEVLEEFRTRWSVPVTLVGSAEERGELESLAKQIGGANIFAGQPLADIARIVANARLYLGNDTGPVHLAQAYGVPGVAIFGGGHWPAYAPWGNGSIALVNPIPCFGCDWDCMFDQGVCVETIPTEEVTRALSDLMTGNAGPTESRVCNALDPRFYDVIRNAAPKYRALQGDRKKRLDQIFELSQTARRKTQIIERLEAEKFAIGAAGQAAEQRAAEMEKIATERLEALNTTDAALRALRVEADLRERGLHELTAIIETRGRMYDQRVAELERAAAERLEALIRADAALKRLSPNPDTRAENRAAAGGRPASKEAALSSDEKT